VHEYLRSAERVIAREQGLWSMTVQTACALHVYKNKSEMLIGNELEGKGYHLC
jgi:hypothetical protein